MSNVLFSFSYMQLVLRRLNLQLQILASSNSSLAHRMKPQQFSFLLILLFYFLELFVTLSLAQNDLQYEVQTNKRKIYYQFLEQVNKIKNRSSSVASALKPKEFQNQAILAKKNQNNNKHHIALSNLFRKVIDF